MAVTKNVVVDLAVYPLADWTHHGDGEQSGTNLAPDCRLVRAEPLASDQCWLIEAEVSVSGAPLDPDGARLWATFADADDDKRFFAVQLRLEDEDGTRQLALYDAAVEGGPTSVLTLALDQGYDYTDDDPRVRVRLRFATGGDVDEPTLYLEAEPSGDPDFERSDKALSAGVPLTKLATTDEGPAELGFGNFGAEDAQVDQVHFTLAEGGTPLPYWPTAVEPAADHDVAPDAPPAFRLFSPGLGEVTLEFDCQDEPEQHFLDGDTLTLSLSVEEGDAPEDRTYSSVPAGLDSHTFTDITDEQSVTGTVRISDVSGRCSEREATVVVDNSGPGLTIKSVTPEFARAGTEVTVEFEADEPLDDDAITVSVGGHEMSRQGDAQTPYRFAYTPLGSESPGPQTVLVTAKDPAGNESQVTDVGGVTFDFIPPSIDAEGASVDEDFVADDSTFNLYVEVTDVGSEVDPSEVRASLAGRPLSLVEQQGSTFQFDYQVDEQVDAPGPQTIEVRAQDLAGNEVEAVLEDVVTFRFNAPDFELADLPKHAVGEGQELSFKVVVADEPGGFDEHGVTASVGGVALRDGPAEGTALTFLQTVSNAQFLEGAQDVVVTVRDCAGNEESRTFAEALRFDFTPPQARLEDAPSTPLGDSALVHVNLELTDDDSGVDPESLQVTLGGREMRPGKLSAPSYPFSLTTDRAVDSDGPKDLVVTVRDRAGNETVETFPAAVSYDFEGPRVTVKKAPAEPVRAGEQVALTLDVVDDYSEIDIGASFVVTLGGREMQRAPFDHPDYRFTLDVDSSVDSDGPQDLVVLVRDAAGNATDETFEGAVTFALDVPAALAIDRLTLVCAQADDGLFHQQFDPELRVAALPTDGAPYRWKLDDIVEWNDMPNGQISVEIEPYDDPAWQSLPASDPRREAIRLAAIVPVTIDVPDAVWQEAATMQLEADPWFRFTGTVDDTPFSVKVSLRTLSADAFCVLEGQTGAGQSRLSSPLDGDQAVTWDVEGVRGLPEGFTVGFTHDDIDPSHQGGRIFVRHDAGTWPALGASGERLADDDHADATFDLVLRQPGCADAYIPCTLKLRKLIGDRHLAFFGQVYDDPHPAVGWRESAIVAPAEESYYATAVDDEGTPLATPPVVFNDRVGLAATPAGAPASGPGDPPWNADYSFNLRVQPAPDSVVPAAFFYGRGLSFRELTPATLHLEDRLSDDFRTALPGPHRARIGVAASAEGWVFGDLDAFDLDSDLDADHKTLQCIGRGLDILWRGGDLRPREAGELAVVLLRADDPEVPLSPPVRVSLPVVISRQVGLGVGPRLRRGDRGARLPDAFAQSPYQAELEALVYDLQPGDRIAWSLEDGDPADGRSNDLPVALEYPGEREHTAGDGAHAVLRNALRLASGLDRSDGRVAAGPAARRIGARVTHLRPDSTGRFRELASGLRRDLSLHLHPRPSADDVAILLDRSSSMAGARWEAARSGAELFASLTAETAVDSRVGVYWFWGEPGDQRPTVGAVDPADGQGPAHQTALGTGLLHGRDVLLERAYSAGGSGPRNRTILLATDGGENCAPRIDEVFFSDSEHQWHRFVSPGEAKPALHAEGPQVQVKALTLMASEASANRLRDVAATTGGRWAEDVRAPVPDAGESALSVAQRWFLDAFAELHGFVHAPVGRTAQVAAGRSATERVSVTLGMDTLVFYHLATDAEAWDLTVSLPDSDLALTPALAAAHSGITYLRGKTFQLYVVQGGLPVAGQEHRWVGDWTLRARYRGKAQGQCALGALCRQDLAVHAELLAPPRPRAGDDATLRVLLADRFGNRLHGAQVTTRVRTPGTWAGHLVAQRVATDRPLTQRLRKSKAKANRDLSGLADQVLRHLYDTGQLPAGRTYQRRLDETAPGCYETRIPLPEAGQYELETSVVGEQRFPDSLIAERLTPHLRQLRRSLGVDALTHEQAYLRRRYTDRQPLRQSVTSGLGVLFAPSVRRTRCTAALQGDRLRLEVTPADAKGCLLGPGWGDELCFAGPAGTNRRWAAEDLGDGRYRVDIQLLGGKPTRERGGVAVSRLRLAHPDGAIRVDEGRVSFDEFVAEVLDVRIPTKK